ncbi:unnamed protein product [Schistocephalus solidus]|uniref:Uncharacterized protein n=1 Tax=Schistocephalus solidus TaxID=70667 RepID=A0A183SLT9_SCHSO|nr:unnamed protein product [Schistocephalus solidus]
MSPKDPLPRQETSGVAYRIRHSCGQSNFVEETGRLFHTRIAEHAAAVRRKDTNSQPAAHARGPGHTKFDEAEIDHGDEITAIKVSGTDQKAILTQLRPSSRNMRTAKDSTPVMTWQPCPTTTARLMPRGGHTRHPYLDDFQSRGTDEVPQLTPLHLNKDVGFRSLEFFHTEM